MNLDLPPNVRELGDWFGTVDELSRAIAARNEKTS